MAQRATMFLKICEESWFWSTGHGCTYSKTFILATASSLITFLVHLRFRTPPYSARLFLMSLSLAAFASLLHLNVSKKLSDGNVMVSLTVLHHHEDSSWRYHLRWLPHILVAAPQEELTACPGPRVSSLGPQMSPSRANSLCLREHNKGDTLAN